MVVGIDSAARAIQRAQRKAHERGQRNVTFEVADAFDLPFAAQSFDVVIDSGLFHVFEAGDRKRLVRGVARVLDSGGLYHVLCFSDREPQGWGPNRIQEADLRAAMGEVLLIERIEPDRFETTMEAGFAHAWLCTASKG